MFRMYMLKHVSIQLFSCDLLICFVHEQLVYLKKLENSACFSLFSFSAMSRFHQLRGDSKVPFNGWNSIVAITGWLSLHIITIVCSIQNVLCFLLHVWFFYRIEICQMEGSRKKVGDQQLISTSRMAQGVWSLLGGTFRQFTSPTFWIRTYPSHVGDPISIWRCHNHVFKTSKVMS